MERQQGRQCQPLARHCRCGKRQLWICAARVEPLQFARQYRDRKELAGYFNSLLGDWVMKHYTVEEYIAQGDVVVARGSTAWTDKKTGKVADTPKIDFWRFKGRQGG